MKKFIISFVSVSSLLILAAFPVSVTGDQLRPVMTNKDRLIITAVQGKIAPAQVSVSYKVSWDGKPFLPIGMGGLNYNIKIGQNVFGWASGDRATFGVAAEGINDDPYKSAWLIYASVGNEVAILSGDAKGEKGIIAAKFGNTVLIHFEDSILQKLAIGDLLQARACGHGVEIQGIEDVMVHGLAPELLEKLASLSSDGRIEVPVVKEIPAEIMGQGSGGLALIGQWHISTCFPPDIKKYGLDELKFGDLVLLQDIQTDYGKGYYKGGATVGIVCCGPSRISALGIGVTPILSTRFGKIMGRIDPSANIGKYLGILPAERAQRAAMASPSTQKAAAYANLPAGPSVLKTNKDSLIKTAVDAVVQPSSISYFMPTYDGKPKTDIGMASINYNVSFGDPTYGWASADHVEPDVTIQGRDKPSPSECAVAILACIGNRAKVISGDAKGAEGFYLGRHAGSDDKIWLPKEAVAKLALNDRVQIQAEGVGLMIDGFEDVRVNKIAPWLLEKLGIEIQGGELVVPVVMEVPGHLMGSGLGGSAVEVVDYDIQTTDPKTVEKLGLKKLRLGDLVAIRDHYDVYGRGRYEGALTIGVCIHGFSDYSGHGPGIDPILSALPGRIRIKIDPDANMAYFMGIKPKPVR
jgi:hypothetical protein